MSVTVPLPPLSLPYGTIVRSLDRTGHVSFHVHTTPLATGVSLMPVRRSETYRLSCDRTSAADSSNDNLKHFCLGLTDHDTLWLFAYLRLKVLLLTYLLTVFYPNSCSCRYLSFSYHLWLESRLSITSSHQSLYVQMLSSMLVIRVKTPAIHSGTNWSCPMLDALLKNSLAVIRLRNPKMVSHCEQFVFFVKALGTCYTPLLHCLDRLVYPREIVKRASAF